MKNKALCLILCVFMLAACLSFSVQAHKQQGNPQNWDMTWCVASDATIDKTLCGYGVSSEVSYSGENCLEIRFPQAEQNNTLLLIRGFLPADIESGTYEVSFMAKGSYTKNSIMTGLNGEWGNAYTHMTYGWSEGAVGDWYRYSRTITLNKADSNYFLMQVMGNSPLIYIDDVQVCRGGVNYLENGGFEAVDCDASVFSTTHLITTPEEESVTLSWKNPEADILTGVELYDITDGEKEILADIKSAPGDINTVTVDGRESGKTYTYKIVNAFSDGEYSQYIFSVEQKAATIEIDGFNDNGQRWCRAGYDTQEKYSGDLALKIMSNIDGVQDNTYQLLTAKIPVEAGEYEIEYYAKAQNASNVISMLSWKRNEAVVLANAADSYDWKKFSYIRSVSAGTLEFQLLTENYVGALWLDDFAVYKTENGTRVSENLFSSGGFENDGFKTEAVGIENAVAQGSDRSVTLSWEKPQHDTSINVYQKVFQYYEKCAQISSQLGTLTFDRLLNDTEYQFAIASVNIYGVEGELQYVSASTVAPDYEIGEISVKINGSEASALESGTAHLSVPVKNTNVTDGMGFELIAALYKDGVLKQLKTAKAEVDPTGANEKFENIEFDIDIPTGEGYILETFLWSSLKNMRTFCPCKIYN